MERLDLFEIRIKSEQILEVAVLHMGDRGEQTEALVLDSVRARL